MLFRTRDPQPGVPTLTPTSPGAVPIPPLPASSPPVIKGDKPRGEVVRLSLDVSPELNETLETLARKTYSSKSDVLRKAIALMEVAVKAKEEKKKFGVAAPGQNLETEIVGL